MDEDRSKEIAAYLGFDGRHLGNALQIVMDTQKAGISHLVRYFSAEYGLKISYSKASCLLNNLQLMGAISPPDPVTGRHRVQWQNAVERE
jgi:hypothetical protein